MKTDEQAIRAAVAAWMEASQRGDTAAVLDLMTDDVVFMVPGAEPFGKEEFRQASQAQRALKIEGNAEVREIKIYGEVAVVRTFISVSVRDNDNAPMQKSGYALSVFIKGTDGNWRIYRDANLLTS